MTRGGGCVGFGAATDAVAYEIRVQLWFDVVWISSGGSLDLTEWLDVG